MFHLVIRRVCQTIPVLIGVATFVFSLIHLVPGDPVQTMLGDSKFVPTKGGAVNQAFNDMIVYQRAGDKFVTVFPKQFQNGQLKPLQ